VTKISHPNLTLKLPNRWEGAPPPVGVWGELPLRWGFDKLQKEMISGDKTSVSTNFEGTI